MLCGQHGTTRWRCQATSAPSRAGFEVPKAALSGRVGIPTEAGAWSPSGAVPPPQGPAPRFRGKTRMRSALRPREDVPPRGAPLFEQEEFAQRFAELGATLGAAAGGDTRQMPALAAYPVVSLVLSQLSPKCSTRSSCPTLPTYRADRPSALRVCRQDRHGVARCRRGEAHTALGGR